MAKANNSQPKKPSLHVEPRFEVRPLEEGRGALLRLDLACAREGVKTPEAFAKILALAGGVTIFTEGRVLLVEASQFALAVGAARAVEALQ